MYREWVGEMAGLRRICDMTRKVGPAMFCEYLRLWQRTGASGGGQEWQWLDKQEIPREQVLGLLEQSLQAVLASVWQQSERSLDEQVR
jgi:hypothetical protein